MIKKIGGYSQCNSVYDTEDAVFPALSSGTHGYATGNIMAPKIVADRSRNYADKGRNLESPKDISNSLTSVQKDNLLLNARRIRRLTPLECERLQGFPDNWTEGHSDTQRYKMCGNAITVPVVEYLVKELLR